MVLSKLLEFQWDKGNINKNLEKHGVTNGEIEQVFFDSSKKEFTDVVHSGEELRCRVVGKTKSGRLLFVVYTLRGSKIRIISARDTNRREVLLYEKSS